MEDFRYEPARDLGLAGSARFRSLRREIGLAGWLSHHAWWAGARAYLALYHRLRIEGRENIPAAPPFIMAANHASHLDALILAGAIPARLRGRVFPIAAGDTFFETAAMSWFAASFLNALPLWRKSAGAHAMKELRERLVGEPCGFILFPEGTRSRDGSMARFKAGLGMLVAGTDVPVVPCRLAGAYEAFPPNARMPRPRGIRLTIGAPLRFAGSENSGAGWTEIASAAHAAVEALR